MKSPLEQFEITPILRFLNFFEYFGIVIDNFTFFAISISCFILLVVFGCVFRLRVIPTSRQYILEFFYEFLFTLLSTNLGFKGQKYFPIVVVFFIFVLVYNLFGLFPFSFTITSQLAVAFCLSFTAFFGLVIIGFVKHGVNFFSFFFPNEAPLALAFLLVPIEIISFISRPFSLGIRLFANMTAGHVLLKILTGFSLTIFSFIINANIVFSSLRELLNYNFIISVIPNEFYCSYIYTNFYIFNLISSSSFFVLFEFFKNLNSFSLLTESLLNSLDYTTFVKNKEDLIVKPFERKINLEKYLEYYNEYFYLPSLFELLFKPDYAVPIMVDTFEKFAKFAQGTPNLMPYSTHTDEKNLNINIKYVPQFFIVLIDETVFDIVEPLTFILDNFLVNDTSLLLTFFIKFFITILFSFFNYLIFIFVAFIPIFVLVFFITLELFVALLQAYVFTILFVIYLRDVLELH